MKYKRTNYPKNFMKKFNLVSPNSGRKKGNIVLKKLKSNLIKKIKFI